MYVNSMFQNLVRCCRRHFIISYHMVSKFQKWNYFQKFSLCMMKSCCLQCADCSKSLICAVSFELGCCLKRHNLCRQLTTFWKRAGVCVYNRPKRSNRGRPADLWAPAAGHLWTSACVPASYHDECDGNPTGFSSQSSRETTNIYLYKRSCESLI